jgi:hypothetical protein
MSADDDEEIEYDGIVSDKVMDYFTTVSQGVRAGGILPDPLVRCNFCSLEYACGVSRRRSHLTGGKGTGIAMCLKCPGIIRRRFLLLAETNKRHKANKADKRKLSAITSGGSNAPDLRSSPSAVLPRRHATQLTLTEGFRNGRSLMMRMGRCMMQMRKAGGSVLSEESNVENLGELQMDILDTVKLTANTSTLFCFI